MIQPTLEAISSTRSVVDTFLGYNHNIKISDGEFYDMKNMTSSYYPVMSPRDKRGIYEYTKSNTAVTHKPNGLISKDALCYVDGGTLYIDNHPVSGLVLTDSPKQMLSMGAYIIIMPDKKYVNTKDLTDIGNIEASFPGTDVTEITVSYEMCKVDGTVYTGTTKSPDEPENPINMQLWIDQSTTPHTLKQYSKTNAQWIDIPTTYIKISYPGIATLFNRYDAVKISGLPTGYKQLQELEGKLSPIWYVYHDPGDTTEGSERAEGTNDYIVVVGILDEAVEETSQLKIERKMPELDFIIESNNRLWGCRYGTDVSGNVVNEIYASKLGDFKNWNCFMGLSTDSYTASCGTDGQWTGAITHLGYPIFFKENCLHKVYGNYPANFQIQTTECRGVQKGAGKSLAIVNETLFYKSRNGVCAYDGSLPSEISSAFGDIHYTGVDESNSDILRNGAVAGSNGNKYYISMKSEVDGQWYLFVYDASNGMWYKEDNTRVDYFCSCRGDMYFIEHDSGIINNVLGTGKKEDSEVIWMAETGAIGTSMPDKKYISNLIVRMSLGVGSKVIMSAQYDSCGQWEHLTTITGTHLRSFSVPIKPKRCDHFRIRIEGVGEAKIFSITKTIEQGSDV